MTIDILLLTPVNRRGVAVGISWLFFIDVAETPTVERIADIMGLALVQLSQTRKLRKIVPNPHEREPLEPKGSVPGFQQALSDLSNSELLSVLDLTLLELERRLYRYAHEGEEIMDMADEGLLLASRVQARLEQALSAAQHTQGHLQVVGVGEWNPTRTNPSWDAEPRLSEETP